VRRCITAILGLLAKIASAATVSLVWDAPVGYVPTGYVVGYGEASGSYTANVDAGNVRSLTLDLPSGRTYYVSVMAYTLDQTSAWSTELVVALPASPPPLTVGISPVIGLWANQDEPGTGYAFDFKHGVLVATVFSYTPGGDAQWYIASGPIVGATFTSRLDKFVRGPCISCDYAGGPVSDGSEGTMTIVFSSSTSATVYLPQGRVTQIRPVPF